MNIIELAANPTRDYRPVPFWSWNDKLEAGELARQIELMHDAGIGGFFMHARGGLLTDYLSDDWFDVTKAAIHAAEKCGMNPWAYDENGWPSGFGGGIVNGLGLEYQQKYLRWRKISPADLAGAEHKIAVYSLDCKRISKEEAKTQSEILLFYFDVNPYYVDTLDRKVTEKFLEVTHQEYFNRLSESERKEMQGFFTDEPQISRNGIPWSFIYESEYRAAYDEELLDVLPALFFKTDRFERTRWRFWRLTTRLFMNNFMKPIHDWCTAHGWKLTGHMVCEDNYSSQLTSNGAVMPMYQYFHIPGMDALGRGMVSVATTLQLASAAAQAGLNQILSETFALCGWAVDFADLKWLYQWQTVHGINLLCQHLEGYSLRGIRKRDYPASLFIHQPWWEHYRPFNDAFSRVGVMLANGEIRTNVLLLHGITTAHIFHDQTREATEHYMLYSADFENLSRELESAHINHHYGDETLMELYGSVQNGRLVIGKQSYSLVLLPKLMNLSPKQAELLAEFVRQGGKILGVQNDLDPHFYLGGELADDLPLLKEIQWFDSSEAMIREAAKLADPIAVPLKGTAADQITAPDCQAKKIHVARRYFNDLDGKPARLYYYVNIERFESFETELHLDAAGVEAFDPETGKIVPVYFEKTAQGLKVPHRFEPAGAFMLLARDTETESAKPVVHPEKSLALKPEYRIAEVSENLLTLDYCGYEADGKKISDHEYVLSVQDKLLTYERDVDTVLTYEFTVGETFPAGTPLTLLIERPERYEISVNGKPVSNKPEGFFADKAFERIAIGNAVVKGRNVIRLHTTFHQPPETYRGIAASRVFESEKNKLAFDSEIEAVYICGNFGVATAAPFRDLERNGERCAGPFTLEAQPETADIRHLEQSGFPFFAGKIALEQTVDVENGKESEPCRIAFNYVFANIAELELNGTKLGTIRRPDYSLDIPAGVLKAGTNTLRITLVNSLRNMLGPFHKEEGELFGVGPASFYKDPGVFCPKGAPDWNSEYCFLRFGCD